MKATSGRGRMAGRRTALLIMFLGLTIPVSGVFPGVSEAAEVAGVSLPDTAKVGEARQTLLLNGAGVRKKFVVKVYVCALYLAQRRDAPEGILDDQGPKRVTMHILMKELKADRLRGATSEGFRKNQSAAAMTALEERLDRFNALFPDLQKGDRVEIDILPGRGTVVRLNGVQRGEIEGEDFARALLAVWLGRQPADKRLKKALLGM